LYYKCGLKKCFAGKNDGVRALSVGSNKEKIVTIVGVKIRYSTTHLRMKAIN
jgi:hypothetical protein